MRSGHDGAVPLLHHHHAAPLHALRGEGGAGVREGRHLPPGQAADGGSAGPGRLLRDSLRGCVREDRHEVTNF